MLAKELCFILLVSTALVTAASRDRNNKKYRVVCYFGSWANYRPGDGKFVVEDIDPRLCTHLVYGFAKLENNRIAVFDPYLDLKENWGLGAYERFNNLRNSNPNLSTLIAIGGWNEGSSKYSQMASNPGFRAEFVRSAVDFCRQHNFDGLDVDWEYPANRGGAPADKQNFVSLLRELKEAFQPHGLILSAAVAAGRATIDSAYDVWEMSKYLDFINVMTYDFHGSWEKTAGHNAPLYSRPDEGDKTLNVESAIQYWILRGAPRNKLVLGVGSYGRSFTLADPNRHEIGSPTNGPGNAGPITREPGMLGYNEICLNVRNGWREVFSPEVAPYAFQGNQWVGYDTIRSTEIKVEYIQQNNLGGAMIWSLDTDDFRGKCGNKYPLLTKLSEING